MAAALMAWVLAVSSGSAARPAAGATPAPDLNPSISLSVEPMLGGRFVPGSWAAVRVFVENNGPTVGGELRVSKSTQTGSTFSRPVELATAAHQEHVVYAQMTLFTNRFTVDLVSGGTVVASANTSVQAVSPTDDGVFVVAERPESLVGLLNEVLGAGAGEGPEIVTVTPEQLPPRAEAWSAVDLLVWQDVDANRLTAAHLDALRAWLSLGGDLVIVGGSTGASTLGAFPSELLPYQPAAVVDVPSADLQAIMGAVPAGVTSLPALSGAIERGTALAHSGGAVIAARQSYGQGTVAIVGVDPSATWVPGTAAASALWPKAFATGPGGMDRLVPVDEGFIVGALGGLPAVQVPPIDLLALLLLAYVVAIGPLNYFVLRRRDRREWAWLTMPATILAFAVGAYGLGLLLKGGDLVVNQLAVVHGAAGSDRGLAQVYVGVYSPSRATFDVKVGGNALLTAPVERRDPWQPEVEDQRPVDIVHGDPAIVRGYTVGFGTLRGFRAEAAVPTPRIEADLHLVESRLEGTIVNASSEVVAGTALVYGDAVAIVGDLAPGESRAVNLETRGVMDRFGTPVWDRIVPAGISVDPASGRSLAARRALVQHITGEWRGEIGFWGPEGAVPGSGALGTGPVILGWQSGGTLDVELSAPAEHIGERLYVIAARATISGPTVFSGGLIRHEVVEAGDAESWAESGVFFMAPGTMTVDYRPPAFDGAFRVSRLSLVLDHSPDIAPSPEGEELPPLPPEDQPDPDQPLALNPRPGGAPGLPALQLYDRTAATWVEFEPLDGSRAYTVVDPGRYVDASGALRVRFVVRGLDNFAEFALGVRVEGTIE